MSTFSLAKGSVVAEWLRMTMRWSRSAGLGKPHETLYHVAGFVVLGLLVGVALWQGRRLSTPRWWVGSCLGMFALGMVVEGLQFFVPARTLSLLDLGGNLLGAVLGLGVVSATYAWRNRG